MRSGVGRGTVPREMQTLGALIESNDNGLPVGAQLLSPYLGDRRPLRVAALAEEAGLLGFRPPPGW